jgi:hypothetical protein
MRASGPSAGLARATPGGRTGRGAEPPSGRITGAVLTVTGGMDLFTF